MHAKPNSTPIRKVPIFTPYVVVWSMFGVLSFGLLAVLGLAPEWLDDFRPAATFSDPQGNHGQRAAARLAAEVDELKTSVGQIQLDLTQMRTDIVAQGEQQKTVSSEVAALQSRLTSTPETETLDKPAAQEVTVENKTEPKTEKKTTEAVEATADKPRVINADATKADTKLETGSLQKKAETEIVSFGPAVVKPAAPAKKVGIKLSSGASLDSLRLSWALLSELHGEKLRDLAPRYTTTGSAANPEYDLVAGPIKSEADAAKICKSFTSEGVPCAIGTYGGNAL